MLGSPVPVHTAHPLYPEEKCPCPYPLTHGRMLSPSTRLSRASSRLASSITLVHTQVQQLREAWASQYATLLQDEALHKQTVHQVEATLRTLAIAIYQSTDRKEIAPGVKVREMTRLIYDPQEALTWAIAHQMALMLDVKAFEQLAKVTALPFVTRTTALQATLSPCLPGERPAASPVQRQPPVNAAVCQPGVNIQSR